MGGISEKEYKLILRPLNLERGLAQLHQVKSGTALRYWTSGSEFPSFFQKHRVAIPTKESGWSGERYSIVYFIAPDWDFTIRCLDGSDTFPPGTQGAELAKAVRYSQGDDEDVAKAVLES